MDQSLITAAAGLRARLESLEVLGNNIANVQTAGFKADREFYNLFVGYAAEPDIYDEFSWLPVVEGSRVDFTQGVLTATGGPLNVALSGPGFLVVEGPQGPLYTRNGSFTRSPAGRLETHEGFAVRGDQGPIDLPPGEIQISEDGTISVGRAVLSRLQVVEFPNTQALTKLGRSYFQALDPAPPQPATRTSVRQGHLEAANVNPAEQAVRLISVTREFEMLTRAVALVGNEMNRRAIDEIARAGS